MRRAPDRVDAIASAARHPGEYRLGDPVADVLWLCEFLREVEAERDRALAEVGRLREGPAPGRECGHMLTHRRQECGACFRTAIRQRDEARALVDRYRTAVDDAEEYEHESDDQRMDAIRRVWRRAARADTVRTREPNQQHAGTENPE